MNLNFWDFFHYHPVLVFVFWFATLCTVGGWTCVIIDHINGDYMQDRGYRNEPDTH